MSFLKLPAPPATIVTSSSLDHVYQTWRVPLVAMNMYRGPHLEAAQRRHHNSQFALLRLRKEELDSLRKVGMTAIRSF